jgi:hypothetical protein
MLGWHHEQSRMTDESQLGASGKEGKRVPAIFFRTEAGSEPVRDWLKSLPLPEDRKRIGEDIKTVEFGWPIGMPVCRALGRGLYEVRSNLAGNRVARVLFYIDKKAAWCFCTASSRRRRRLQTKIWNWLAETRASMKEESSENNDHQETIRS